MKLNRNVGLFSIGDNPQYLHACDLWRVMFTRKTLIVRCRFDHLDQILSIANNDLHVVFAECRNPREYIAEDAIMRFYECRIKRSWMIDVTTTNPDKVGYLNYNIEFEYDGFWVKSND